MFNKEKIADQREIAAEFITFFKNIGSKLACEIPNPSKPFETFMKQVDENTLFHHINQLKTHFFSLKTNISPGYRC